MNQYPNWLSPSGGGDDWARLTRGGVIASWVVGVLLSVSLSEKCL